MMQTEHTNTQQNSGNKRKWIYPLIRKGKLYHYRSWLSYFYLIALFTGPFIRINGEPLLMLNIIERKFVILGQVFWPQDFFLFVLAMLTFIVCIVLFTMAFGRVFCGWICPQTIFMEMVFRKVEELIEGDANKRRKLDAGPWTKEKVFRKTGKHAAFMVMSFLIANIFLAYIIGSDALLKIITEPVSQHVSGFISIWVFTGAFYGVYSQLREIVCTTICPYGRLQGVLTDKHTLNVAYNFTRGEPRGKLSKSITQTGLGDCVDCGLCVSVCPTGIDIRKGNQLECINCTACIDVCDQVMEKIGKPTHLIGFYSDEMIKENKKFRITARMGAFSGVIAVLVAVLSWFAFQRKDVDVTVLRSAGVLYQEQPGGYISNLYNADIINKTNKQQVVNLVADDPAVRVKYIQAPGVLPKEGSAKAVFFVYVPASRLHSAKTDIKINVVRDHKVMSSLKTTFVGPVND